MMWTADLIAQAAAQNPKPEVKQDLCWGLRVVERKGWLIFSTSAWNAPKMADSRPKIPAKRFSKRASCSAEVVNLAGWLSTFEIARWIVWKRNPAHSVVNFSPDVCSHSDWAKPWKTGPTSQRNKREGHVEQMKWEGAHQSLRFSVLSSSEPVLHRSKIIERRITAFELQKSRRDTGQPEAYGSRSVSSPIFNGFTASKKQDVVIWLQVGILGSLNRFQNCCTTPLLKPFLANEVLVFEPPVSAMVPKPCSPKVLAPLPTHDQRLKSELVTELDEQLLRGVPLDVCLSGFGKHWDAEKRHQEDVELFSLSRPTHRTGPVSLLRWAFKRAWLTGLQLAETGRKLVLRRVAWSNCFETVAFFYLKIYGPLWDCFLTYDVCLSFPGLRPFSAMIGQHLAGKNSWPCWSCSTLELLRWRPSLCVLCAWFLPCLDHPWRRGASSLAMWLDWGMNQFLDANPKWLLLKMGNNIRIRPGEIIVFQLRNMGSHFETDLITHWTVPWKKVNKRLVRKWQGPSQFRMRQLPTQIACTPKRPKRR